MTCGRSIVCGSLLAMTCCRFSFADCHVALLLAMTCGTSVCHVVGSFARNNVGSLVDRNDELTVEVWVEADTATGLLHEEASLDDGELASVQRHAHLGV